QTVRNNRPTDKQHEKCQAKHGVAPAIGGNKWTNHKHWQKGAANANASVSTTQGQAQFAIEPRCHGLQIPEWPQSKTRDWHKSPQQVVNVYVCRREIDAGKTQRKQRN